MEVIKTLYNMTKGYFLTSVINQALPFFLLPILTRFLSPSEYGALSLFVFYHSLFFALVGASLPNLVGKYFYDRESKYIAEIIGNGLCFSLFLAILSDLVIVLLWPLIRQIVALPLIWILILPISAFANVIFSYGLTVCRCRKKVLHFGFHQIGNTFFNVLLSLFLVCLFYWGWKGRALGYVLSFIISAFIMLFYLWEQRFLDLKFRLELFKENVRFATPLIPNSVQLVLISQVGLFFMQYHYSQDLVGLYSLGFQLAFCVKLLVDTLVMSWSPFLYEQLSLGNKMDNRAVKRIMFALVGILLLGVFVVVVMAKPVLIIMTTPDYYGANQFVIWFVIGMFFYGIYCFVQPVLIKYNKQKFIGQISFLSMIIMFVLNLLLPKFCGYLGVAYAYCITYVFLGGILTTRALFCKRSLIPFVSK